MKRRMLVLVLLLCGVCLCASAQEGYTIGVSQCNLGEPWRVAMNEEIAAAVLQYPMLSLLFMDAAQDNSKQIADIERLLEQDVDLLIVSPNETLPLTYVVEKAYQSGTPVILLDRKIAGDGYTQYIGADNHAIGKACGEYALFLLPKGGTICEIKGLAGTSACVERSEGFYEAVRGRADIVLLDSQNADWLRGKAIEVAETMLDRHPVIDVFYCHNDPMAGGAHLAAQKRGREADIAFIGIDGLTNSDGGIQAVLDGKLSFTVIYPTGGAEAIDSAYRLLVKKEPLEKQRSLDFVVVTAENAGEYLPDSEE